jgi:hypothetical protein
VLGAMGLLVGLGGCMIVDALIRGVVATEAIWGDVATGEKDSGSPRRFEGGRGEGVRRTRSSA